MRSHYLPYLSKETKLLMEERNALKDDAVKYNDEELMKEYRNKRNEVKSRLQPDKDLYYKSELNDNLFSSSKVWKTVYNILGIFSNKSPTKLRIDGEIVNNPQKLADTFNQIFLRKVKNLIDKSQNPPQTDPGDRLQSWLDKKEEPIPQFHLQPISLEKLRKIFEKVRGTRTHGDDFIDSFSIKLAFPLIEDAILHIVNLSINTQSFAERWKVQLVFPLHKKADKLVGENYRPVSHIIEIGKIVEYAIYDQVYEHFVLHNLFHGNHHGTYSPSTAARNVVGSI